MVAVIYISDEIIKIRQATKLGYIELPITGGIADLSFPTSKLRRGRVQWGGQIAPTLTCGGIEGLYYFEPIKEDNYGKDI